MSYRKYNTQAIVLKSADYGEADRFFTLFTQDIGRVDATARSVRAMKSKLRYALQDYALIDVSLVQGKAAWRITGAAPRRMLFSEFQSDPRKLAVFLNILSLLNRLVQGQERDPRLFEVLENGVLYLLETEMTPQEVGNCEILFVLRILNRLGYLKAHRNLTAFLNDTGWNAEAVHSLEPVRSDALQEVNRSLNAIQM